MSLSPRLLTSLQVSLLLHLFPPVNWVILLKQKAIHVTPLLKAPGKVLRIAPRRLWNLYPTRTQSTITLVCSFHSSHTGQNSLGLPQCFGTIPSTWNAFPRDINMANSLPTKSLPISVSRSPPYFKFRHPQKFWIPPALLHSSKHLPLNILYYFLFITPHWWMPTKAKFLCFVYPLVCLFWTQNRKTCKFKEQHFYHCKVLACL